jgi:hypothetical protein
MIEPIALAMLIGSGRSISIHPNKFSILLTSVLWEELYDIA